MSFPATTTELGEVLDWILDYKPLTTPEERERGDREWAAEGRERKQDDCAVSPSGDAALCRQASV